MHRTWLQTGFQWGLLSCIALSLSSCAPLYTQQYQASLEYSAGVYHPIPQGITKIVAQGPLTIDLSTQSRPVPSKWGKKHRGEGSTLFFRGHGPSDPTETQTVHHSVQNHTLYLDSSDPVHVVIRMNRPLSALSYKGSGSFICNRCDVGELKLKLKNAQTVNINDLHAMDIELSLDTVHQVMMHGAEVDTVIVRASQVDQIEGHQLHFGKTILFANAGKTDLQGYIDLKKLIAKGDAIVNVLWVDTAHRLLVRTQDNAQVFLAGAVDWTDLLAKGDSAIDARYLRTKTVFARAEDNAKIGVTGIDVLHAYAINQAQIYYYQNPKALTSRYYRNSGVVLYGGYLPPMPVPPHCAPIPSMPG